MTIRQGVNCKYARVNSSHSEMTTRPNYNERRYQISKEQKRRQRHNVTQSLAEVLLNKRTELNIKSITNSKWQRLYTK